MSSENLENETPETVNESRASSEDDPADRVERLAQVELLAEENRRLREEYARTRQSPYRRTASGLAILGLVAALGGLLFPDGRDVLFALAGTGLFGGLLTYYLTPARFVPADVSERIYATMAANEAALAAELGLTDDRRYLPTGDSRLARLFVPQRTEAEPPSTLSAPFVTDEDHRGLVLEATGTALFRAFERTLDGELATSPDVLGRQLADGLVETLEFARSADPDVDAEDGRATVSITESGFGDIDRFDHPIASFLAVGFAVGLERPVALEVVTAKGQADWLVTCRWEPTGSAPATADSSTT